MRNFLPAGTTLLLALVSFGTAPITRAQSAPQYWTVGEDARFASDQVLRDRAGNTVYTLDGSSLVALVDAENRIAEAYGLKPALLISSAPGLNAAALEVNGRSLVFVNADTVRILGPDRDLWCALFGHEFGHLYHHHSAVSQARVTLLQAAATFLNAYEARKGRDTSGLVNFGALLVNNAFTRDQEREADATGVVFMARAGFDPEGAVRLQELLVEKYGSTGMVATFLQNHPSGLERIRNIKAEVAGLSPTDRPSDGGTFSANEFGRHLALCNSKNAQVPNERRGLANYSCLRSDNPEFAKRFALCVTELKARDDFNQGAFNSCVAQSPVTYDFSYVTWRNYCQVDRGATGVSTDPAKADAECLFSKADRIALRGIMCETEAQQTRTPSDQITKAIADCSRESASLAARFDRYTWLNACRRKSVALAEDVDTQKRILDECMAESPTETIASSEGAIDPQSLLIRARAALSSSGSADLKVPVNECDRRATLDPLPGVTPKYLGWIDPDAAETACLSAIKQSKIPGRFQAHLAAVYLQQGKWADAFSLATKASQTAAGKAEAEVLLAIMYGQGLGVEKSDRARAVGLLTDAVGMHSVAATTILAQWTENGSGLQQDVAVAVALYELAADHEDQSAQANAARLYLTGVSVHQDLSEARRRFHAAEDDFPPASRGYALTLASSPGDHKAELPALQRTAVERVRPFAEKGSLPAKLIMGWFYQRGFGVEKDPARAFTYFREAADAGYPSGDTEVAYCYLNGNGVPISIDKAKAYFEKAAAHGVREASVELTRLNKPYDSQ